MSESEKERAVEKHAEPAPPIDVPEAVRERVRAQASPVRCPFCHDDVRVAEQRWVACAGCLARHHVGCWGEAGRCAACGDAASLAGGGGSRSRAVAVAVAAVVVVMLLFLSIQLVVQREFTDLRRDLAELTARPPAAAQPARGPYPGETPAVAALRAAANAGDGRAAYDLSRAFAEGREVVPDFDESHHWLQVAAGLEDVRAMKALADRFGVLPGYPDNLAKSAFWYRRALATKYDGETARSLARLLDREDPERKALLDRLAKEGSGEAWIELGWLDRGREALLAAADRGDARARYQLHELEAWGRFAFGWDRDQGSRLSPQKITERRPAEAKALLTRWAAEGDAWAKAELEDPFAARGVLTFEDE